LGLSGGVRSWGYIGEALAVEQTDQHVLLGRREG
jgi:hypothetical protein